MTELEKSEICNKLASAFMEFAAMLSTPDVAQAEEDQRQYYTVKDLAELLRKSENTIRMKIRSGEFGANAVKDGRTYLVPKEGLQNYYASHSAAYKPPESRIKRKQWKSPGMKVEKI